MAVTAQTITRTNLREFAFTRDNERANYIDHVFSHSVALSIFANQSLGDFGGTPLRGRGHRVEAGGHQLTDTVVLGEQYSHQKVSAFDVRQGHILPRLDRSLFAGESMFHRARDASKVALVHLVVAMSASGGGLLDVQWQTEHLSTLGAVVIGRDAYLDRLEEALRLPGPSWGSAATAPR